MPNWRSSDSTSSLDGHRAGSTKRLNRQMNTNGMPLDVLVLNHLSFAAWGLESLEWCVLRSSSKYLYIHIHIYVNIYIYIYIYIL